MYLERAAGDRAGCRTVFVHTGDGQPLAGWDIPCALAEPRAGPEHNREWDANEANETKKGGGSDASPALPTSPATPQAGSASPAAITVDFQTELTGSRLRPLRLIAEVNEFSARNSLK